MEDFIVKDFRTSGEERSAAGMFSLYSRETIKAGLAQYHLATVYGNSFERIQQIALTDTNPFLQLMSETHSKEDSSGINMLKSMMLMQHYLTADSWKKSKQTYQFDSDFISELARTDTSLSIPQNVFHRLPFKTFYLDYSANPDVCSKIGADGCLTYLVPIAVEDKHYWLFMFSLYQNQKSLYTRSQMLCNSPDKSERTIEELSSMDDALEAESSIDMKLQTALLLQSLLYLSSVEPDIRDDTASKLQYRKAKQAQKKGSKTELPMQLHAVGERYGEAFRKWTKGSLGQPHDSTGTGKHVKPHIRRAHWHRYWIGKKGQQELVIKWISECFCGCDESTAETVLDNVKHKV